MERKVESFIVAFTKSAYGRVEQLMLEGLSRKEATNRATIEIAFGESSKWPESEVVECLRVVAQNGIRPDIDKSGGKKYSRTIDL